mmetsp:Transcript_59673/g.140514  ORF Transcript_59673/g.140514 Transcript_59673/m.140514 type:complete len:492 (+) Transcript_59673:99-1574(+)
MKLAKGAALDSVRGQLSVLSYNILAPLYVRPTDERTGEVQAFAAFKWAEPAEKRLAWDVRWPKILSELVASRADVICLQEIQFEKEECDGGSVFVLPPFLKIDGYEPRVPPQRELAAIASRNLRVLRHEAAIGNAVLVRSERLSILDAEGKDSNTKVQLLVCGREGGGLEALGPTSVACVHLDAKDEEQRVKSIAKCIEQATAMGTRELIVCGDFNTECLIGSAVGAFVSDAGEPSDADMARECASALRLEEGSAPSAEALEAWCKLHSLAAWTCTAKRVALARAPTGATRAAYAHDQTEGVCQEWRLDHIFYTKRTLQLEGLWSTLEEERASAGAGLPSLTCPSDHLPVAACFRPLTPPKLPAPEAAALFERLAALDAKHAEAQAALTAAAESELRSLEASEAGAAGAAGAADAPAAEANGGGKGKKAKTAPPSPAMQALLRGKREREKALKRHQRSDRAAFLKALGELERDALEQTLPDLMQWAEAGAG